MSYPSYTEQVLLGEGYVLYEFGAGDFVLIQRSGVLNLEWHHATEPKPSAEEIKILAVPYLKKQKRIEAREWADTVVGRTYPGMPSSFDDAHRDHRLGVRLMVNNLFDEVQTMLAAEKAGLSNQNAIDAVSAVEAAMSEAISKAESKSAFADASDEVKLNNYANEAKKLKRTEINAQTDSDVIEAMVIDDTSMATIHETANPGLDPSISTLLLAYPGIVD